VAQRAITEQAAIDRVKKAIEVLDRARKTFEEALQSQRMDKELEAIFFGIKDVQLQGGASQGEWSWSDQVMDILQRGEINQNPTELDEAERELILSRRRLLLVQSVGKLLPESYEKGVVFIPEEKREQGFKSAKSRSLISALFDAEEVPQSERDELMVDLRVMMARATRPKWRGRLERGGELATLSAPLFLKKVHAAEIGPDNSVSTEIIRAIDPDLMKAVEVYLSQRRARNADFGDAEGLRLVLERPKPELRAARKKREPY
jgi:hypothetical protein